MNFWPKFKENKPFAILLIILLIAAIAVLIAATRNIWKGYRYIGKVEARDTIAIQGRGKIIAVPDIAMITIGLNNEKKEVTDAQKENAEKINAFINDLKKLGIKEKDIATANYNIYPVYNYEDGRQVLRGYQVSQNVNVKIRDLKKISDILSLVSKHSLNQVGGLNFTFDDLEKLKQQARVLALKNAAEKARTLANVAGVKLGKVISFSESNSDYNLPARYADEPAGFEIGGASEKPRVEAGSQDIVVYVTVSYEIY